MPVVAVSDSPTEAPKPPLHPFHVWMRAPFVGPLAPPGPHRWPVEAPDPLLELLLQSVADPLARAPVDLRVVETDSGHEVEALVDDALLETVHTLIVVPAGVVRVPETLRRDLVRIVVREAWEDARSVAPRVGQALEALVRERAYFLARVFEARLIEEATEALACRRGLSEAIDTFEYAPLRTTRWGHVCELAGCVFAGRKVAEALEVRSETWHAIRQAVPGALRETFAAMRASQPLSEADDIRQVLTDGRRRLQALEDDLRALALPCIGTPLMALEKVEAEARRAAVAATRSMTEAARRLGVDRGCLARARGEDEAWPAGPRSRRGTSGMLADLRRTSAGDVMVRRFARPPGGRPLGGSARTRASDVGPPASQPPRRHEPSRDGRS